MLAPEDFETFSENTSRHGANEAARFILVQLAAEFRNAAVDLERVLNCALDSDSLRIAACDRVGQTGAVLDQCLNRYLATRDIKGVA